MIADFPSLVNINLMASDLLRLDIQGLFCYDMTKVIIHSKRVFYETVKRVLLYLSKLLVITARGANMGVEIHPISLGMCRCYPTKSLITSGLYFNEPADKILMWLVPRFQFLFEEKMGDTVG